MGKKVKVKTESHHQSHTRGSQENSPNLCIVCIQFLTFRKAEIAKEPFYNNQVSATEIITFTYSLIIT